METDRNAIRFYIDQPTDWSRMGRCLRVFGWCFGTDGKPIHAIRLAAGAQVFFGVVGLPRPDVKAALPEAPNDHTGFEIHGKLPAGRITLVIEVKLSGGTWHRLLCRRAEVTRQFRPLWLGGGTWVELMLTQMPAHMTHPPRTVQIEKFPLPARNSPRPNFSIVTPSYRHAHFLEETIRSVLEQREVDCQYVVQDGGSTDGSADIIGRHANRLHAWASTPDKGQADAIAKGFAQTTGGPEDLMAWINSDDFYLPGALNYVADCFARNPNVDVLYGHRIVVNEESQEIARWFLPKHDDEVLRLNDFVPQETIFWRRRIWEKAGGLDTSFKFAMDWDLLLRFQAAGARIVRVPYFLACFRVHPAQKTSAVMHDVGQREITLLRERTHGRPFPPLELEQNPRLIRYLRKSAWIEFLWRLGIRAS